MFQGEKSLRGQSYSHIQFVKYLTTIGKHTIDGYYVRVNAIDDLVINPSTLLTKFLATEYSTSQ